MKRKKVFTLDGKVTDIVKFVVTNDLDLPQFSGFYAEGQTFAERIDELKPGEELVLGGGAGASYVLRRES